MATQLIRAVRLPRCLLPEAWPEADASPLLADLEVSGGRFRAVRPHVPGPTETDSIDLAGALALLGLLEAHAHLDKAFTRQRLGKLEPGLLAAIAAMQRDRAHWTDDDLRARAERALRMAWHAGVTHLRTHVDWWSLAAPRSWHILTELAYEWRHRVRLQRVALVPLPFFASAADAATIAAQLKDEPYAVLGGFVHTSNYSHAALDNLLHAALSASLDLDLHVDEELDPQAHGLEHVAAWAMQHRYIGRIVCGHVCTLASRDEAEALALLDRVSRAPITLVTLPATNLLLQDASLARTPRQRGLTLVKEAHARGIPVLIGSDNVQDAFCPLGNFDPVEALRLAVMAAQLDDTFDTWAAAICRDDWLAPKPAARRSLVGLPATLTVFPDADPHTWPASTARRVLRGGAHSLLTWS